MRLCPKAWGQDMRDKRNLDHCAKIQDVKLCRNCEYLNRKVDSKDEVKKKTKQARLF